MKKKNAERENKYLSKSDLDRLINNALEKYSSSLNFKDEKLKSETKLTYDEELIFKSYFKELNNSNLSKIKITNYYISQIANLKIHKESLQFCLNTLSFIRQLMVSIDYDKSVSFVSLNQKIEDFDACVDACMDAKARAVFDDGN